MKLRAFAWASLAALTLSAPAGASDAVGWYLGLGAGWDHLGNFHTQFRTDGPDEVIGSSDAALITGSAGYRLPIGLRLEAELGWDRHDASDSINMFTGTRVDGRIRNLTGMANAAYDWHLTPQLDFTLGAGIGISSVDVSLNTAEGFNYMNGEHVGFGWQAMAGFAYSVTDNLDVSIDYRYREFSVHSDFGTAFGPAGSTVPFGAHLYNDNEHALMFGLRYYLFPAVAAVVAVAPPPPPPPPPLPPAPPPPPPVKTFIVFFDFNKSNLTAEAQAVVSEAVKTARQQGAVRILVTGHTDTVGSHSYNQGLSERRANSVKSEMVRQGMDAGEIGTEGKSFDEPLVPTGPGVREPQNRRAVIDLGAGSGQ